MATGDNKFNELKYFLKKIFQFEDSDLDFGIYRIMNLKKKEVENFIENELKSKVDQEFSNLISSKEVNLKEERDNIKKQIENTFGGEVNSITQNPQFKETPLVKKYLELDSQLKQQKEVENKEDEIYDNLLTFFSRYYDDGDFISQRRYSSNEKYAIPYNGEEVYLHWANHDQYYVKTSESFNYFKFKAKDLDVEFKISSEEVETDKNNNKSKEKRYFVVNYNSIELKDKNLQIFFGYRSLDDKEEKDILDFYNSNVKNPIKTLSQEVVNTWNVAKIKEKVGVFGLKQLDELAGNIKGDKLEKTILEYNLNKYTKKNTSDYFIHKDLEKFLKRELDFYIKNELLKIDDLLEDETSFKLDLNKIQVFKSISSKIIEFLAQIENFQKKLFEKKKFVVDNQYCLTIDNLDEKYYNDILKNKEQLEEWIQLGFVDNVKEVDLKFLKENPTLVLDTKFFSEEFKYEILSTIENLDEKTNGLLINSENYQALNLLQEKYKENINCCYIDPPYNTNGDDFLYKDGFKSSSWKCLIFDRLIMGNSLLKESAGLFISIDDNELSGLNNILERQFKVNSFLGNIIWEKNYSPKNDSKTFSVSHDYILAYSKNFELWSNYTRQLLTRTDKQNSRYKNPDNDRRGAWMSDNLLVKTYSKDYDFPIETPSGRKVYPPKGRSWMTSKFRINELIKDNRIWFGKDGNNVPRLKRFLIEVQQGTVPMTLWKRDEVGDNQYAAREIRDFFSTLLFSTPKPTPLVKKIISVSSQTKDIILDYFAGSASTGHAVLNLNKEDGGNRKYILVEMGEYFNSVTKPRIQKVIFSQNWKNGKPQDNDGSKKHIFKYQSLEQYEDSLNNIHFKEQPTLIKNTKDYDIKYMMEFESKENNVFLNLDNLEDPFNYTLDIFNESNEKITKNVDLIETFNYIAGIDVEKIQAKTNNKKKFIIVKGKRDDSKVIVIWRNKKDNFNPQEDKDFIEKEIIDQKYDEIYINGQSTVENAKVLDEIFKTRLFN